MTKLIQVRVGEKIYIQWGKGAGVEGESPKPVISTIQDSARNQEDLFSL